jgi:DNA-directed RNA polymerase subunit RPC12/RpoP
MAGGSSKISVKCPRCKKDVPANGIEAGMRLRCPKCLMDFLVSGNSLGRDLDEEEEYGLQSPPPSAGANAGAQSPAVPAVFPVTPSVRSAQGDSVSTRSEAEEAALYKQVMRDEELEKRAMREKSASDDDADEEDEDTEESEEPSHWLPKKPAPSGLYCAKAFFFLFDPDSLIRLCFLAIFVFFTLILFEKAFDCMNVPAMGISTFGPWFTGMMLFVVAGVSSIGTFIYAAALAMSILLDTANGQKRVESWPRGYVFEWLEEAGYVLFAIFWSALPSVPLGWLLQDAGIPPILITVAIAAFLFPLALLAELDLAIVFFPGSHAVWMSPLRARRAWLDFYLITVPLMSLIFGLAAYGMQEGLGWLILLASLLAAASWLLYFHFLGRLAWYASGKAEQSSRRF